MKRINLTIMATALALTSQGANLKGNVPEGSYIGRQDVKIENGLLSPESIWAMGRVGRYSVAPDGKKVV